MTRRARTATTVTFIINGFSVGAFVARIPDIKNSLDISDGTLGLSLLFISLGVFLALKPAGRNCAKFGSQPVIFWATFCLSCSLPLVGIVHSLQTFWIAFFIFGFVLATQDVAMNAQAVTVEHKSGRRVMSFFHAMWSVGTLSGGLLGGLFSQMKITLLIQFLILSLAIFILGFILKPLFLPGSEDMHPIEKDKRVKQPAIFWILGIFGLLAAVSEGAAGDWGGVLVRDTFGASPFISTMPYLLFCSAMIIGRLSGDFLATKFSASKTIATGGLFAGVGLSIGLIFGGIHLIILSWFLLGLGLSVVIPLMFSAAGSIAKNNYSGVVAPSEVVAKVSGVSYFGFLIGPPMIGFIADYSQLRWALLVVVGFSLSLTFAAKYAHQA